jgi:DAACS family dicarboxylate/amino acid:cation (Na+ or H+) symporter
MSEPVGGKSKGIPLHTKILLGLVIGAILGILANTQLGADHRVVLFVEKYLANPAGQIFLNLLFMIVIPLVFASIALGVAGLGDLKQVGRVGGKTLGYFLITTALSATLGLIAVRFFEPGGSLAPEIRSELLQAYAGDAASKMQAAATSTFGIQTLINIVTRNPVKSAVDLDLLGIIFFGLMFGAAITMIPKEKASVMMAWLDALNEIVIKIVEIAMKLAPYGVAGLIFGVTSRFGYALLKPLGSYILVVIGALLVHVLVTISLIVRFGVGMSPMVFFNRIRASIVTAFSTSSSSATLPTNLAVAEQNLGVPPHIAGFVLPLGATMCMNGTSLFEGVTVLFLSQVFGLHLSLGSMIVVMVMVVITAVGAAGVPGGSLPLLVSVMAMFHIPPEGIAIILGVDRILDMSRTTVNVIGDMSATAWIAKTEGAWSAAQVPEVEGLDTSTAALDETPVESVG